MPLPYELPESIPLGAVLRGDTIKLPVWVALDRDGEIIDLTDATLWFTAKKALADDDGDAPGFQLSTASSGVEVVDEEAGEYRVTIPPSVTTALATPTVFQWDVQVRAADGETITVTRGTIAFHLDVTRAIS